MPLTRTLAKTQLHVHSSGRSDTTADLARVPFIWMMRTNMLTTTVRGPPVTALIYDVGLLTIESASALPTEPVVALTEVLRGVCNCLDEIADGQSTCRTTEMLLTPCMCSLDPSEVTDRESSCSRDYQ